ncbi:uncharacterized protein EV420DRAFT_1482042 [Desarmillaria tabescens]|uniref:Uncharacterized protein n=1 Tax=Armillaria tabescens TaxID=1929756 RepID=A0AA39N0C2_ARMTA|nr:uncharacterized protein EV420DRAFT_1482042 [Desarmillaria tabescens]KAK0452734.1 hypothetical protein EV420DRAFT_1482042 [Desarmillaria tabescens]
MALDMVEAYLRVRGMVLSLDEHTWIPVILGEAFLQIRNLASIWHHPLKEHTWWLIHPRIMHVSSDPGTNQCEHDNMRSVPASKKGSIRMALCSTMYGSKAHDRVPVMWSMVQVFDRGDTECSDASEAGPRESRKKVEFLVHGVSDPPSELKGFPLVDLLNRFVDFSIPPPFFCKDFEGSGSLLARFWLVVVNLSWCLTLSP